MIYVEGRLRTRQYTDQAGVQKYTTEVVADNIQLLSRRPDEEGAQPRQQYGYPAPQGGPQFGGNQYSQPQYGQPAPPVQSEPVQSAAPVQPEAPAGFGGDPSDDLPF